MGPMGVCWLARVLIWLERPMKDLSLLLGVTRIQPEKHTAGSYEL